MVRRKRSIAILLAVIMAMSMAAPVYAAPKKTVYVITKERINDSDGGLVYTYKYSYDRHGLLKGIKYSDSDKYSYKSKFKYNGKGRAVQQTYTLYKHGEKKEDDLVKYKYTKAGYLKSARSYYKKKVNGKSKYVLYSSGYLTWNKKGLLTRDKYNFEDDTESVEWYKYNKTGNYIGGSGYDTDDEYFKYTVRRLSKTVRELKEYRSSEGELALYKTIRQTIKHGDVISETEYYPDDPADTMARNHYTYKKLKVSKKDYKKIIKQQSYIDYLCDY